MSVLSSPVHALLDLFATELADVRFGDVDASALARLAGDVQSAADLVASAQAQLDGARATLQERQDALLLLAQRALAHARIHAEADEAMSARLEAIALSRPARRARGEALVLTAEPQLAPRPRGRPRRAQTEPMLDALAVADA